MLINDDSHMKQFSSEERITKMLKWIKKYHGKQFRNNGKVPYWYHCQSVSEIVGDAFMKSGELSQNQELLTDVRLAAMGHDLVEDTTITNQDIENEFGPDVAKLVHYLTNYKGDDDRRVYVEQITNAPEEAKLIKLGDMIENCTSVAYALHDLGVNWTETFFFPIINEMKVVMDKSVFVKYPKTSDILLLLLEYSYNRLYNNYRKFLTQ